MGIYDDDLSDHPFSPQNIAYELGGDTKSDRAWYKWIATAERLCGHSLDGDQSRDGYSLDYALEAFNDGWTPGEYVSNIRRPARTSEKPAPGSQQWAETYGDDLGESPDY